MLMRSDKGLKRIYRFLASRELTLYLFTVICPFLALTTFSGQNSVVIWSIIRTLLTLVLVNLSLCTLQGIKSLSRPVLIMHCGVIISFVGGGISSYGYVATVNIYEGSVADTVYRWDIERDVSLGVKIMVRKLHEEFYPVPVKVGVKKGGEKYGLFVLKTGESFDLGTYSVRVDSLDRFRRSLRLSLFQEGKYIGSYDTGGKMESIRDFPFELILVAFQDPVIRRTWVNLELIKDDEVLLSGRTEVNHPLQWEGLRFSHTATDADPYGQPFIGLQITKTPGLLYVYLGFCVFSVGGVYYLVRRVRGLR